MYKLPLKLLLVVGGYFFELKLMKKSLKKDEEILIVPVWAILHYFLVRENEHNEK